MHRLCSPLEEGDKEDRVSKADPDFLLFRISLRKQTLRQRFCAGSFWGSAGRNNTG